MAEEPIRENKAPAAHRLIPVAFAMAVLLFALGLALFLVRSVPLPAIPPPVSGLDAAALGDRIYLFLSQRDPAASAFAEVRRMKTVEDGRLQDASEVKPFHSVLSFSGRLWFFNPGMYRVFDGKEWQRFDAPWIGADPVAAAASGRFWIASRIGTEVSFISHADEGWDRPVAVPADPKDRHFICSESCPSGLAVFQEKIHYFWLKDDRLHRLIYDGGPPGRVESLGESFGRLKGFEVLAEPDRILIWYLPIPTPDGAPPNRLPIGLKIFDGQGWHDRPPLDRPAPAGLLEIAALRVDGAPHLLINTGIRIEDQVRGPDEPGRSVFLMGGDLGRSVLQYQGRVLFRLFVTMIVAVAALSFLLNRWKRASGDPEIAYASLGRRFAAKAVDTVLVAAPIGLVVWSRLDPESLFFPDSLAHWISAGGRGLMMAPLLLFTYHALAEGLWGQTLGKRLFGIRVIGRDLKPCSLLQSMVRNLFRLIDGVWFYGVGIVSIAATERWQRLGDLVGRTVVVRIKT
ncbi:MAG: RDD family protein [Nitrospirae bacterium]|nr:RDD family protein [Nitrospirota bacterium]